MHDLANKLYYKVFSTKQPLSPEGRASYNDLYKCWHSIWEPTFSELEGIKALSSDEFYRLDEVTGIYYENAPIGVFCYNWYDLELLPHRHHSYFEAYPEDILETLHARGVQNLMTMGHLGVIPAWRRKSFGLISELMVGLACKRFLNSNADALLTYTRNGRKVNHLGYRHGGECLKANHTAHNVSVDILIFNRENVIVAQDPDDRKLVDALWNSRSVEGELHHLRSEPEHRLERAA